MGTHGEKGTGFGNLQIKKYTDILGGDVTVSPPQVLIAAQRLS